MSTAASARETSDMTTLLRGARPVATSASAEMVSTPIRRLRTVRFIPLSHAKWITILNMPI
ncbi:hypothetical protein Misp03_25900 [Microbispora sp. NBRC 16548]|nr:hypothetical protein Misp03_25900 [Microbispora sp. NBRC 16548]